jgi:hypothetical protein
VAVGDGEGEGVSGVRDGVEVGLGVGLDTLTTDRGQAEAPIAPRTTPITKAATTAATAFRLEITSQA